MRVIFERRMSYLTDVCQNIARSIEPNILKNETIVNYI